MKTRVRIPGLRLVEQGFGCEISGKVTLDFRTEGLVCEWDMKLL